MAKTQVPGKRFQRTKEDFVCEKCGVRVAGSGFTNHCPSCLFSKHVDIHPGDRLEACGGLMEPIAVEKEGDEWKLTHRCTSCGFIRKNKSQENDHFEAILSLARKQSKNRH